MSRRAPDGLRGMFDSPSTHSPYTVSTLPTSRQVVPAASRDQDAAIRSHVFATPVVREISRPAPEPLAFAATW